MKININNNWSGLIDLLVMCAVKSAFLSLFDEVLYETMKYTCIQISEIVWCSVVSMDLRISFDMSS